MGATAVKGDVAALHHMPSYVMILIRNSTLTGKSVPSMAHQCNSVNA